MLKTWSCTCPGCPTQYEGQLESGEYVYFRFRWGRATFEIARDQVSWYNHDVLFRVAQSIGEAYSGVLGDWEVRELVDRWLKEYERLPRDG